MKTYCTSVANIALLGLAVFISLPASADTKEQIMASKYMKYGFCMEKTYGQPWTAKSNLETVMNKWGVHEPTVHGLAAVNESVRQKDRECRLLNGLEDQPRP